MRVGDDGAVPWNTGIDIRVNWFDIKFMIQKRHNQSPKHVGIEVPPDLATHPLTRWLTGQGWQWFPHQLEALSAARSGQDFLLISPTGSGKTLAGFLPSLVELSELGSSGKVHTLYISPLKALTTDVHRNIEKPIGDLALPITFEVRTGDTSATQRKKQRQKPPDMLMTTPESLALLTSDQEADQYFSGLRYVIVDELHAILHTKRADLLSLNLERLQTFAHGMQRIGLSATLADPQTARDWLCRRRKTIITANEAAPPDIRILQSSARIPLAGHRATHTVPDLYAHIRNARMSVVFVNTRSQAEALHQELSAVNNARLRISLHHGSLDRDLRLATENAMASGELDCVVATSSLDLGVDWADVALVIQVGAPKGTSRLLQRVGRANHRIDSPSRAILAPTNRLEYLECVASIEEIKRGGLDGPNPKVGSLDVLAQHILGVACHAPFSAPLLYREVKRAWPYRHLSEQDFADVLSFVQDGGYSLRAYERFSRLVPHGGAKEVYGLRNAKERVRYRLNVGTIVEAPSLQVRHRTRVLGRIEESFILNLSPGDTFLFGGHVLEYVGLQNATVMVRPSKQSQAAVPTYAGGRMPLSTQLSQALRTLLADRKRWKVFPTQIQQWLQKQAIDSWVPSASETLIETFPWKRRHYVVIHSFAGWNANQTLGFLVTRNMQKLGLRPLGFSMNDYSLAIWALKPVEDPTALLESDFFDAGLDDWMKDTSLIRRLFRDAAVISGLTERKLPGKAKTGKQVLFSTDLIFDVLLKYEPNHVLLRSVREDARHSLIESGRVKTFLDEARGHWVHRSLETISPLSLPIVLQIGRESLLHGEATDALLEDMEAELLHEVGLAAN